VSINVAVTVGLSQNVSVVGGWVNGGWVDGVGSDRIPPLDNTIILKLYNLIDGITSVDTKTLDTVD
jgi:hypothetical protein